MGDRHGMGPGATTLCCWFDSIVSSQLLEGAWYRVIFTRLFVEAVKAGTRFIVSEARAVQGKGTM